MVGGKRYWRGKNSVEQGLARDGANTFNTPKNLSDNLYIHAVAPALLVAGLAFPVETVLRRWGVIDIPNARSSHITPVVRGGGLAIVPVIAVAIVALSLVRSEALTLRVIAASVVLAVMSFIDDLRPLRPLVRFGCHVVATITALALLGWPIIAVSVEPGRGIVLPAIISFAILFLWVAGYTNAFNFMDGINGIAAGQAIVTGLGMALVALLGGQAQAVSSPVLLSFVVAGAAAGFLPHNFPKARMFMGDVGSAPLGFLLAVLVVWLAREHGSWLLVPLALLHANFVLDTGITLTRRILRGEKWYEAHREHFYQRLVRSGKSHTFVTLFEMGLQLVVLGLMVVYIHGNVPTRLALIATVLLIWLSFFVYAECQFRKVKDG